MRKKKHRLNRQKQSNSSVKKPSGMESIIQQLMRGSNKMSRKDAEIAAREQMAMV
jgi:hypothetical protein